MLTEALFVSWTRDILSPTEAEVEDSNLICVPTFLPDLGSFPSAQPPGALLLYSRRFQMLYLARFTHFYHVYSASDTEDRGFARSRCLSRTSPLTINMILSNPAKLDYNMIKAASTCKRPGIAIKAISRSSSPCQLARSWELRISSTFCRKFRNLAAPLPPARWNGSFLFPSNLDGSPDVTGDFNVPLKAVDIALVEVSAAR